MTTSRNKPLCLDHTIQAITFDAVGTLIVPHPSVGEIYSEVLGTFGYTVAPDRIEKNFICAFRQFKREQPETLLDRNSWFAIVAQTLHGLTPKENFNTQFEALWYTFTKPDRWKILPGVESTLQQLQAKGIRLFVLSNNDERLHSIINGLSIGQYFEAVFVSSELGAEKPSSRIFELVQAVIEVKPASILHVGDSVLEDVHGALNAGWQAALVGSLTESSDDMKGVMHAGNIRNLF